MAAGGRLTGSMWAIAAAALFGASTPFAKRLLDRGRGELAVAGLLYAGAALGLGIVTGGRRLARAAPAGEPMSRREWTWLLLATVMGGFVAPALLMVGLSRTGGIAASLLLTIETPATALIAWAFFRERIGPRVVVGGLLVLGGTAAIRLGDAPGSVITAIGTAAIVASCFAWAMDNNATTRIAHRDALRIARFKCVCAAPFTLALAAIVDPASVRPAAWTAGAAAQALATGLFGYGLSLACFVRALRAIGAARTGALFATAPFVSAVVAMAVLGDRPTLGIALAGALMAAGTFVLVTERQRGPVWPG